MKKRAILLAFIISAVAMTSGCSANEPKTDEVKQEQTKTESVSSGVTIKPLTQKAIDENPYMAKNDANIHHDCYNSDSTDEVLPVGIYPEINVSYEKGIRMRLRRYFLTIMDIQLFRCWEDLQFVISMQKKHRRSDISHQNSMTVEGM